MPASGGSTTGSPRLADACSRRNSTAFVTSSPHPHATGRQTVDLMILFNLLLRLFPGRSARRSATRCAAFSSSSSTRPSPTARMRSPLSGSERRRHDLCGMARAPRRTDPRAQPDPVPGTRRHRPATDDPDAARTSAVHDRHHRRDVDWCRRCGDDLQRAQRAGPSSAARRDGRRSPGRLDRRNPDFSEGVSSSVRFYRHLREHSRSLSGVAVWSRVPLTVVSGTDAYGLSGNVVSDNYFEVLGVRPELGDSLPRAGMGSAPRAPRSCCHIPPGRRSSMPIRPSSVSRSR